MIPKNYYRRLVALEAAASTPLRRAEDKARRDVPPADWETEELQAFTAVHCRQLKHLTDRDLEAFIAEKEGTA